MKARFFFYPFNEAVSSRGGLLSGFVLAPLAVILVSLLMFSLLLGPAGKITSTVEESILSISGQQTYASSSSAPDVQQSASFSSPDNQYNANAQMDHLDMNPNSAMGVEPGMISPIFTHEIQYWAAPIASWANTAGVSVNLAATVMQIESCGNPDALSRAGAIGLFQVMPFHFSETDEPYEPGTNAMRGLAYLKLSLDEANGDARLALAGYNGGIGVIGLPEASWAAETVRYAYWGSGIYSEAENGVLESPRLQEWLVSNGIYLCKHAAERLGITP